MNILLHICCAPCAIHPVEELKRQKHAVAGYFYNPNIHPCAEYVKRRDEVKRYAKDTPLTVVYADYDIENYFQRIVYNEAPKDRCPVCWWTRIEAAAKFAKENGFDAFTTTLLGSPYQDHGVIRKLGEDVASSAEITFHYEDYRAGFRAAHERAKAQGLYCQNYCGCIFSERERVEKKDKSHKVTRVGVRY